MRNFWKGIWLVVGFNRKICSSNGKSSPIFGVKIPKMFELPPPRDESCLPRIGDIVVPSDGSTKCCEWWKPQVLNITKYPQHPWDENHKNQPNVGKYNIYIYIHMDPMGNRLQLNNIYILHDFSHKLLSFETGGFKPFEKYATVKLDHETPIFARWNWNMFELPP